MWMCGRGQRSETTSTCACAPTHPQKTPKPNTNLPTLLFFYAPVEKLEADKEMRKTVALYNTRAGDDAGGAAAMAVGGAGSGQGQSGQGGAAEDEEAVQLDELLSGFTLRDEYEESKFKVRPRLPVL